MIQFTSNKASPCLMFNDNAVELLKILKASGNIPAAIAYEDLATFIVLLQKGLANLKQKKLEADSLALHDPLSDKTVDKATERSFDEWHDRDQKDLGKQNVDDQHVTYLIQSATILLEMFELVHKKGGFIQWDYA